MTIDELATAIAKVKAATDKPFGVNIAPMRPTPVIRST